MGTQREAGPSDWRPTAAAKARLGSPSPEHGKRRRLAMSWRIRLPLLIVLLAVLAYVFVDLWRDASPLRPALVILAGAIVLLLVAAVVSVVMRRRRNRADDKSTLRL